MFWVVVALVSVVVVKYYTSIGKRKLEERLTRVKTALVDARKKLRSAQNEQAGVTEEMDEMEERIRRMKEIMDDLGLRMQSKEQPEEREEKMEKALHL